MQRERERGSRRDVYVVDDDAWHDAMMRHDQLYAPIMAALAAGAQAIDEGPAHDRVALAREFLEFMSAELDAVSERWEEHKRSRRPTRS